MERTGSKRIDELVRQAVSGNGTAFTALWDEYIGQLRSYVRGWIKNIDDLYVDDICSRSFEKAFRQIGSFDPSRSQFFTWLRTIAHNTALDVLDREARMHPRHQTVYLDDEDHQMAVADTLPDQVDTALDSIIKDESMEATAKYIDALPELYRDIARRRLLDGAQYKEIADELGMELNTVRTRIRRAKQMIDRMSREDENEI